MKTMETEKIELAKVVTAGVISCCDKYEFSSCLIENVGACPSCQRAVEAEFQRSRRGETMQSRRGHCL